MRVIMGKKKTDDLLWHDRKRLKFFGLPWTFTRYSVSKERLFISRGFLNVVDDEVRLYRVMDISLKRTLTQRIFGLGTIRICSGDKSLGDFELINVKHPKETKELISELVEQQRDKKRVINRDDMNRGHMHGDDFEPHDFHDFDDADGIGMEHGHEDFDMDDDAPFER